MQPAQPGTAKGAGGGLGARWKRSARILKPAASQLRAWTSNESLRTSLRGSVEDSLAETKNEKHKTDYKDRPKTVFIPPPPKK